MTRNCVFFLTAALILLAPHGVRAEQARERESRQEAEQEIRQLEDGVNRAIVEGDVAFFDRVLAEDFTHTSQSGRFRTKAEWMKGRKQSESSYLSFATGQLDIRIYGDIAIVTGLSGAEWRESDGREMCGQFRFLRVWVKRQGQWQAAAFQGTAI